MPCGVMFLSRSRILKVLWALMTVVLFNKLVGKDTYRIKIPSCFICPLSFADAVGQHQDSCSCSLADTREKLCGVNLALSFIVFISHEEKQ